MASFVLGRLTRAARSAHSSSTMLASRILLLAHLSIMVGCSKAETPEPEIWGLAVRTNEQTLRLLAAFQRVADSAQSSPPAERLSARQYFSDIHLVAYEKAGTRSPKWDDAAKRLLTILSTNFPQVTVETTTRPPISKEIEVAANEADKAGCEDPLVRFLILRSQHDAADGGAELTNSWVHAADELEKADYPLYWKFHSRMSAAKAIRAEIWKRKGKGAEIQGMFNHAYDLSVQLLNDRSLPPEAMYSIVDELCLQDLRRKRLPKWSIEKVQPLLISNWSDTAEAWNCIGRFHIRYAWEQRGNGYAKTVTKEGWQAMAENLGIARIAFEKSWAIKPMEATAVKMLTVEIGNTQGRAAMEKWFSRAMELNPACYAAAGAKFQWLTKSWHGNDAEVIAFGRECVTNTAYRGRVPLINREVHRALADIHEMEGRGTKEEYWRVPGVWPDVKATFERFFAVNPENVTSRYDYALLAYHARAWDDFRAQIKLIDPIDYDYFGGKEVFQKMLARAERSK
jgi:hypothetical protein